MANPYHAPAGSPQGGQFTSKAQTNTSHGDKVEGDADRSDAKASMTKCLGLGGESAGSWFRCNI